MFSVSKAEHASSMGPTLKLHVVEEGGGSGDIQASCLVAPRKFRAVC